MLESVLVRNISNSSSMMFSYQEELNGIIVKDTSGLHPSEVTINYEGSSEGYRSENVLAPAARNIKAVETTPSPFHRPTFPYSIDLGPTQRKP